jgi:acylphosphatase
MSDTEDLARIRAIISGFVQRVGFRQFAILRARHLGLNGWVMNRPDGSVELVAEGDREQLEALIESLERGPTYARVERVQVTWEEPQGDLDAFAVQFAE